MNRLTFGLCTDQKKFLCDYPIMPQDTCKVGINPRQRCKMESNMKFLVMMAATLMPFFLYPCPITITNDGDQTVLIVDPKGTQAIFLMQNKSAVIDPTITRPFMRYFTDETLDIYFPTGAQPEKFYKKYRLTEKYCTDDEKENQLTTTQILQFEGNPTDRFKLEKIQVAETKHDHAHH